MMKVILAPIFIGLIASTNAEFVSECPKDGTGNQYLADPENCNRFYICQDYVLHKAYCPGSLHFDIKTLECIDPKDATCAAPSLPVREEPEGPVFPVKCPEQHSPKENVLLPNPKDCTTFYQCVYGYPHLQHCPNGLHFNDEKKWCDWPKEAHCISQP